RLLVGGAVLFHYRHIYTALRWACSWTAVAVGAGVFVLWTSLHLLHEQPSVGLAFPEALAGMGSLWATIWLVLRLLGYVLLTPLIEELAFRAYLISRITGVKC